RIEFKSTLEFFFETRPIPLMQSDVSQRGVSFAQRIIYLESLLRRGLCLQKPLPRSYDSSQREQRVRVCESSVCGRVRGVLANRLVEVFNALPQSLFCPFVPEVAAPEI